jgi:hypothetical protein
MTGRKIITPDRFSVLFYPLARKSLLYAEGEMPPPGPRRAWWCVERGFIAPALGRLAGHADCRCAAADTLVLGGNPLLGALALLRLSREGKSAVWMRRGGEDEWGHGLLRHPGFRALLERAAGMAGEAPLVSPYLPEAALPDAASRDALDLASWLERFFSHVASRLEAGGRLPPVLSARRRPDLAPRMAGGEAMLVLEPEPGEPPALSGAAKEADSAAEAGLRRRLPMLVFPVAPDKALEALFVRRVILTSQVENLAQGHARREESGAVSLDYDHPAILPFGSARHVAASAQDALSAAIEDVMRLAGPGPLP